MSHNPGTIWKRNTTFISEGTLFSHVDLICDLSWLDSWILVLTGGPSVHKKLLRSLVKDNNKFLTLHTLYIYCMDSILYRLCYLKHFAFLLFSVYFLFISIFLKTLTLWMQAQIRLNPSWYWSIFMGFFPQLGLGLGVKNTFNT